MEKLTRSLMLFVALFVVSASVHAQIKFQIGSANDNIPAYLRIAPTFVDARVLAAGANESHTVPTGARWVIFSSSCAAFYAKTGGTAAVPAGDVTDGSASELNPAGWLLAAATTAIGLISPTACTITLSWYLL